MTQAGAGDLGRAARALQELGLSLAYDARQQEELESFLESLDEANQGPLYAVRSSSPEEDLDGASFAGGYETSLGVRRQGIEPAILHSFRSGFDERVFVYKKEHGFRIDQPRIAVIVQQQVGAESAGVAFSLNLLNNCYDEAVINANHGLGESVVSGEAEPDVFVVDRLQRRILETRIGSKQVVTRLDHQGGTVKSTPASNPRQRV